MDSDLEKRMIEYLLGQLSAEEEAALEARYMADSAFFEELLAVEDDLRDAYERGELSAPEKRAFEQRLLVSSEQVERQEFVRSLRDYVRKDSLLSAARFESSVGTWKSRLRLLVTGRRILLIPVLSATFLLLISAGWWLEHRTGRQPASVASLPAPKAQGSVPAQPDRGTIALVLTPGVARGQESGLASLLIPPGASWVRLELRFEADYSNYEAVLETPENKRIWSAGNLKPEASAGTKTISVDITSSLLQRGDYILTLYGTRRVGAPITVAEYPFRVDRK
ncbi:MAG: hypothetical protein JOZ14_09805 [Acidobacteria bacterium]|nr:hypothetical protein [Acidobacteriota bacterium]